MRDDPEDRFSADSQRLASGYGTEVAVAVLDYALTQRRYSRVRRERLMLTSRPRSGFLSGRHAAQLEQRMSRSLLCIFDNAA
jgi:hypothetical protein